MPETTKAPHVRDEDDALKLLIAASEKYDEYLRITVSSGLLIEEAPKETRDWNHPMGLVLAKGQ